MSRFGLPGAPADVPDVAASGPVAAGAGITVAGLRCSYGRLVAVDGVDLRVAAGEHVALLGANGSGKSTLVRSIAGLHRPDRGTVRIGDRDVTAAPQTARRLTAWVPQRQTAGRFPLRLDELLAASGDADAARAAAVRLGLDGLLRRPMSTLSGGQLQRAHLARALGSIAAGARVLVADEPTAALDFDGQAELAATLRDLSVTVLVVTHDRAVAEACDRRVEMAAGRLREAA